MRESRVIYKRKATYIKPVSQARALGKEKGARSVNKIYLVTQVLSKTVKGNLQIYKEVEICFVTSQSKYLKI